MLFLGSFYYMTRGVSKEDAEFNNILYENLYVQHLIARGCHLYTNACCHHWPDTFIFLKVTLTTDLREKRIPI